MVTEVIGSIDQGTQSTRFFLYDKDYNVVARSQVPLQASTPFAGWVEQDANAIIESVREAVRITMEEAAGRFKVVAVGLTNQRETTVAWDSETGEPLTPAIVWSDVRTSTVCHEIERKLGSKEGLRGMTGLPVSTYFSAYKLKWMVDHVPEVAAALAGGRLMAGTVDTWVTYNLTGGPGRGAYVTDVTNASRTSLMDIHTLQWHVPTMKLFGFEKLRLAEIRSSAEPYGTLTGLGLGMDDVPIAGCLGDQQAAMLGQRCAPGHAKNTYGTGCFMLMNTGERAVPSRHGLLTTVAYKLGRDAAVNYALEGAIAVAGQGVSWLRSALGFFDDPAESETLAASVPTTGGVYLVPAFGGLLAPWWRDDARGVVVGLTQYTTKAHLVRAMLEAIAFQTLDVLEAMEADAGHRLARLAVDGGGSRNGLLMQIQADLVQTEVRRPANQETTSLGAAIAAGISARFWTIDQVFDQEAGATGGASVFKPRLSSDKAKRRHAKWKLAVQRALELNDLADSDEEGVA